MMGVGRRLLGGVVLLSAGCTVLSGADRLTSRDDDAMLASSEDAGTDAPVEIEKKEDAASDAAPDAEPSSPIPQGALVARWPFDEGSGTIIGDATGRGHDGLATGGTWIPGRPGKSGNALRLDGTQRVDVPAHPDFDRVANPKMTLTIWARRDETMDHDMFFSISYGTTDQSFGIEARTETTLSYFDSVEHQPEGPASVAMGTWHHYAVVIDGTQARVYLDGDKIVDGAASHSAPLTSTGVMIGGSTYGDRFKGAVDEARIYRLALDDEQLAWDRDH